MEILSIVRKESQHHLSETDYDSHQNYESEDIQEQDVYNIPNNKGRSETSPERNNDKINHHKDHGETFYGIDKIYSKEGINLYPREYLQKIHEDKEIKEKFIPEEMMEKDYSIVNYIYKVINNKK